MDVQAQLQKVLKELERVSGLPVSLAISKDEEEAKEQLASLKQLLSAYKEKYNSKDFLLGLMRGRIPSFDCNKRAQLLHIDPNLERILFLLNITSDETAFEDAQAVLKNMLPSKEKAYAIPVSDGQIALLMPAKELEEAESKQRFCESIIDTMNMEALVSVHIAYSDPFQSLLALPNIYRESNVALKVGMLFHPEARRYPSNRLGIGRLIASLPIPVCNAYTKEVFGDDFDGRIDEEIVYLFSVYLKNNLNITETARVLHMHRNTLLLRLEKLERATGLNLRNVEDALTFQIALMVIRYENIEKEKSSQ